MRLTAEQQDALGVALNEATVLGAEVDAERRLAALTFQVLTLPETGPPPADCRVQFLLSPVGRVAALLREGVSTEDHGRTVEFELERLLPIVQSFRQPIYGWRFFCMHEAVLREWEGRRSFEWSAGSDGLSQSLWVFQEDGTRVLDVCLWFDELEIRDPHGNTIELQEFCDGGERWWKGLGGNDPRTHGFGIFPGKAPPEFPRRPGRNPP